ncbi:MAG: exodeoxyribonuclease VII large subunit [Sporomusaceae bacterium]|nr:exodeoxyribonuclease VII large subunit [Sporomusaceae bacterium]
MIYYNSDIDHRTKINNLNDKYNKKYWEQYPDQKDTRVAGYDSEKKKWFFDETFVNHYEYKEWLTPGEQGYLDALLSNFFTKIDTNLDLSKFEDFYELIGDIYSIYEANGLTVLQLTDSADGKARMSVTIPTEIASDYDLAENQRVSLGGKLAIYKKHGQLQFKANDIEILEGVKTRRQEQLDIWKTSIKWIHSQKNILDTWTNIGVISNDSFGKGYHDFDTILNSTDYKLFPEFSRLSAKNIAALIGKFNNEKNCDCICIIRGGGSSYDLLDFNNPILIQAMCNSSLPILTGVGHALDVPICSEFSDCDKITPSDLAHYLKDLQDIRKNRERKKIIMEKEKLIPSQTRTELQKTLSELIEERDILQARCEELETENRKLKEKQNKNFLRKIFSW